MLKHVFALSTILLAGCTVDVNTAELNDALLKRASFDLNCQKEKIKIVSLQGDEYDKEYIYGAEGCGNRQTYQVITNLDTFKIYKEGAAPKKVIVNQYSQPQVISIPRPQPVINTPTPQIGPRPLSGPRPLGY